MDPAVRATGRLKPMPIERRSGLIPTGRFEGGEFVTFEGAEAVGVDFSRRRFRYLSTQDSTFVDCDFSHVRLEAGYLDPSHTSRFVRCRFDSLRLGAALLGVSRFEQCSFEDMRAKDLRLEAAEFVDCRFSGRFDGLVILAIPGPPHDDPQRMVPWRTANEFHGNDFSRADLRFADFRFGVDLTANRWPSGSDYLHLDRWPDRLRRAFAHVSRWVDDAERERALWWLRFQSSDGRERQAQSLIRRLDWSDIEPTAMWDRLWADLATPI